MGVIFMKNRLEKMWNRQGEGKLQIIDLENGFFDVSFNNQEHFDTVFQEGPWLVADHYLIVQRWKPKFDPLEYDVTKITAWIRVSKSRLEYYNVRFLWRIRRLVWRTLKLDPSTSITSRGKFARICVDLELRKKLVRLVEIGERNYVGKMGKLWWRRIGLT